jgi:hypothetical protein
VVGDQGGNVSFIKAFARMIIKRCWVGTHSWQWR